MRGERHSFTAYAWVAAAFLALAGCAQLTTAPEMAPAVSAPTSAEPTPVEPSVSLGAPPEAETAAGLSQRGPISFYGNAFLGKRTASGEVFDPERLTMAHRTLPFGTRVRVTNLENQRSVDVIVNDRGPFVRGRIADLSAEAARQIGMVVDGVVEGLLVVLQTSKAR
jgi:rare lipoprotein A